MLRSEFAANEALQTRQQPTAWQAPSVNAARWNRQHTKSSFGLVVLFSVVAAAVKVVCHG